MFCSDVSWAWAVVPVMYATLVPPTTAATGYVHPMLGTAASANIDSPNTAVDTMMVRNVTRVRRAMTSVPTTAPALKAA